MLLLDWVFIATLASAILFALFVLFWLISLFYTEKKLKQVVCAKTKSKRKRKKIKRIIRKTTSKRKKQRRNAIICFVVALCFFSTAFYSRYYQATNLGERDSEGIVQGYYLLNETINQINELGKNNNAKKTESNLRELAAKLSSFGMRGADGRLTKEGQRLLTRYYSQVKELGLNLNNQSSEMIDDPQICEEYIGVIHDTQVIQKKIIDYFKINENALAQKK